MVRGASPQKSARSPCLRTGYKAFKPNVVEASMRVCQESTNSVHAGNILPVQHLVFSKIQEGKQPRYPPKAPFDCLPHSTHPFVEHTLLCCQVGPAVWFQQHRSYGICRITIQAITLTFDQLLKLFMRLASSEDTCTNESTRSIQWKLLRLTFSTFLQHMCTHLLRRLLSVYFFQMPTYVTRLLLWYSKDKTNISTFIEGINALSCILVLMQM